MQLHRTTFTAMASANEIQLYAPDAAAGARAAQRVVDEVARIEAKYSRYRADTIVTRINEAAGRASVAIDEETASLLRYADSCYQSSGGRFDVTSGVLRRVWNFREGLVPSRERVREVLRQIGWDKVRWSDESIYLPIAGMEIDFGGIGKEYAADRAAVVCMEAGVAHGLVNLGGDVRVIGPHPDGSPWIVGIRHPRRDGATIASIALGAGALATSGDYERYFERNGIRYSHVLNPRTGYPVRHWQSASIIAPLCIAAGSYSTIAMLLEARATRFLEREGLPYLLVGPDGALSGPLAPLR
jgi:thiamine biosynthesis lipoprotein